MELHLRLPHWRQHQVDWVAAAVSGFAAGAVLMVLELLWGAFVSGDSPWRTSHSIAAILLGPSSLKASGFAIGNVVAAMAVHYLLGIAFGIVLGAAISGYIEGWDLRELLPAGALFGAALYVINFYGMSAVFPWFATLRGWPTFVAHLVFGMSAALIYWKLQRTAAAR